MPTTRPTAKKAVPVPLAPRIDPDEHIRKAALLLQPVQMEGHSELYGPHREDVKLSMAHSLLALTVLMTTDPTSIGPAADAVTRSFRILSDPDVER